MEEEEEEDEEDEIMAPGGQRLLIIIRPSLKFSFTAAFTPKLKCLSNVTI